MNHTTNRRTPTQPASGTFRWLQKPDVNAENGVLKINAIVYLLSPVREDDRRNRQQPIIGWKLTKADHVVYDIYPAEPCWSCDCGDYLFNRDRAETPQSRECKHIACLRKALPLAGI